MRITHIPTGAVAQCQNERSQHRNREVAMKMLRSRLYEMELRRRRQVSDKLEASKADIDFGSQIRSYVLHPYRLVKDHRTKFEVGDADRVLNGDLDPFIKSYLLSQRGGGKAQFVKQVIEIMAGAVRKAGQVMQCKGLESSPILERHVFPA